MSIEYYKGHDVTMTVSWSPRTSSIFVLSDATAWRTIPNYSGQPEQIPVPGSEQDLSIDYAKARADWFLGLHGWRPASDWRDAGFGRDPISAREYRWLPGW